MARRIITKRIGEVLVERGVINRRQLEAALKVQKERPGVLLGQILIDQKSVGEEEIALALTAQYGFPFLPLDSYEIDPEVTECISEEKAAKYCLIPVDRIGNSLTLAMADPSNVKAIEEIELETKCVVQAFVSTPSEINRAIEQHYKKLSDSDDE